MEKRIQHMGPAIPSERTLKIDWDEATRVRKIFSLYLDCGCVSKLKAELDRINWRTPGRSRATGEVGYRPFSRGHLYRILNNPIYIGKISHKGEIYEGQHEAIIDMPLWDSVQLQLQLKSQSKGKRGETTQPPKLLAGLLFDAEGQILIPTYIRKGTRLYQYYVSNDLHLGQRADKDQFRIPALELEQAVTDALSGWLGDEARIVQAAIDCNPEQVLKVAQETVRLLCDISTRHETVRNLVRSVTVHQNRLEIELKDDTESVPRGDRIEVPIRIKRAGMAVRLIVGDNTARPRVDKKLVTLIAKAHRWFEMLESGRCDSMASVARQEKVTSSYVTRVMYLAFLSPDIIQCFVQGKQPPHLSADTLIRMGMPPADWADQWCWLGMKSLPG